MEVLTLGAGQDVGRSCVVVTLGDKRIMFDCGMHMGYRDERRFPNFDKLAPEGGSLTGVLRARPCPLRSPNSVDLVTLALRSSKRLRFSILEVAARGSRGTQGRGTR